MGLEQNLKWMLLEFWFKGDVSWSLMNLLMLRSMDMFLKFIHFIFYNFYINFDENKKIFYNKGLKKIYNKIFKIIPSIIKIEK